MASLEENEARVRSRYPHAYLEHTGGFAKVYTEPPSYASRPLGAAMRYLGPQDDVDARAWEQAWHHTETLLWGEALGG